MRKLKYFWAISVFIIMALSGGALAEIDLDSASIRLIQDILSRPAPVYQLDLKLNRMVLDSIDKYVAGFAQLSKAQRLTETKGIVSLRQEVINNVGISAKGSKIDGVKADNAFDVYYDKGDVSRVFRKDIFAYTTKALPDNEVIGLAKEFLSSNGMYRETANDKIDRPKVTALIRQQIFEDSLGSIKYYSRQKIDFTRMVGDFAVVNSKMSVDIHPSSREILGFKHINWTPLQEGSPRRMTYYSLREITAKIDSAFGQRGVQYDIESIRGGYFQTDSLLFPVLQIEVRQITNDRSIATIGKAYTISLAKDLQFQKPDIKLRRPEKGR